MDDTLSDLQASVQSDLSIDSNSTLFPPSDVVLAINRAYRKAGGFFRWPETEDAKTTSTVSAQNYYDYPQNWRPHSIKKLAVNAVDYGDPLTFDDFNYEIDNNFPSGLTTMWTNQWRRFFIYPTPSTNGANDISVWGQKIVDKLVNPGDTTIFSYSMGEGNEAVILEAGAILKAKGQEESSGQFKSTEAKQILINLWTKVRQDITRDEKTTPFFSVPDYFRNKWQDVRNKIGNF